MARRGELIEALGSHQHHPLLGVGLDTVLLVVSVTLLIELHAAMGAGALGDPGGSLRRPGIKNRTAHAFVLDHRRVASAKAAVLKVVREGGGGGGGVVMVVVVKGGRWWVVMVW